MAQDKRQVDAITARDVDFAQWYTDVCKKAELIVWMLVIGWASDCGSRRDEPRENKNPYSAKQYPNSGSAADKKTE